MKIEQFHCSSTSGWNRPLEQSALRGAAQVVLLFGSTSVVESRHCVPEIQKAFPKAHVFGCSAGDVIEGTQVNEGALTLTAIYFEHSRVTVARAPIAHPGAGFAAGEALMRQFKPEGLRHVFVLSDGLKVNASHLVSGINAALPDHVTVSGGFAADGDRLQTTHVWCDGAPEQAAAIALGFYGERLQIGTSVTGGWGPFGPDRVITKSRENVLYAVDGRPALGLYKQYLGDYASGLPATGLMFPLELRVGKSEHRVLRALLSVDEAEQSITFAGNVPEGAHARFMVGHIEDLIGGALTAARATLEQLKPATPELTLLVSCNARRAVLKQRVEEEVEAIREVLGERTALAGFYSYGEIGPPGVGASCELHNETITITSLAES